MISSLVIINTSRCNLKCTHCLRGYNQPKQDISLEIVHRLLTDSKPYGIQYVSLTGGEPGLQPEFDELVRLIVNAGYAWSVVSNGQQIKIYENALSQYGFALKSIALSLDGASASTHDSIRGAGSFERLIRAAKYYVDEGHRLYILTCANRNNLFEFEKIVKLSEDLGASRLTVMSVIPTEWNSRLVLTDLDKTILFKKLIALKKRFDIEIYYGSSLHTDGGIVFCPTLKLSEIAVNYFGELVFCCDTIESGAVIGSLQEHTLPELLQMWLSTSVKLQSERISKMNKKEEGDGFNTCAFCNSFFSGKVEI